MTVARHVFGPLLFASVFLAPSRAAFGAAEREALAEASLPQGVHRGADGRYRQDLRAQEAHRVRPARRLLPSSWAPGAPIPHAAGAATGMGPDNLAAAYQIPVSTSAGGKIVALIDDPDSNAAADLTVYRTNYHLPVLPKCGGAHGLPDGKTPCFAQVDATGGASTGGDTPGDSDEETALDMDMISAACPDCAILLVEATIDSNDDYLTAVKTAAKLGAVVTSISDSDFESGSDPTGYTTPGHLVVAASGDWAYDLADLGGGATPSYPSSAPDVVAVGGTALYLNGGTYDEAVWSDGTFNTTSAGTDATTSGCSIEFAMPSWQASALAGSGCSQRAVVDLSAAAAFFVDGHAQGISFYRGGWIEIEGTSATAPMVAALLARLGLTDAISKDLSWEYTHASAFHDLGSVSYPLDPAGASSNAQTPSSCGILCNVGTGWDGPSGVGTPNASKLALLAGAIDGGGSEAADAGIEDASSPDAGGASVASVADDGSAAKREDAASSTPEANADGSGEAASAAPAATVGGGSGAVGGGSCAFAEPCPAPSPMGAIAVVVLGAALVAKRTAPQPRR